jgi:hypothetical protein
MSGSIAIAYLSSSEACRYEGRLHDEPHDDHDGHRHGPSKNEP